MTPRRDSSNGEIRKEKRAHYDESNSARMLLDRAMVTGISLDKIGHETATGGRAGVIGTEA